MKNITYDRLRFVALVLLPLLASLYFMVATIWELPHTDKVMMTITTLDASLGALLGYQRKLYNSSSKAFDGTVVIDSTNPENDVFTLNLDTHPLDIAEKDAIRLKIDSDTKN